jgi:hypothetical protein
LDSSYLVLDLNKGVASTGLTPGGRTNGGHVYDGELFWLFGGFGLDGNGKYALLSFPPAVHRFNST